MKLDDIQIERWRSHLREQQADASWMESHRAINQRRLGIQREFLVFLRRFLAGEVSVTELKTTFDTNTRTVWDTFGLAGMSGAMFLNMLVKYIPDRHPLSDSLKAVLRLPESEADGRDRMNAFMRFLQDLIRSGDVAKRQLQPARLPFFVSACWHLQDTETWPIYYISARKALQREGLFDSNRDPIEDYFRFKSAYLAVKSVLDLGSWDFEHLCNWCDRRDGAAGSVDEPMEFGVVDVDSPVADDVDDADAAPPATGTTHTQVQYLLSEMGRHFGCRIWIATNDHGKEWNGKKLGTFSVPSLPNLGIGTAPQRIISLIDVLWIKGSNQIVAAFEIEHTTSVYSGLLRMCDLTVLAPNLLFPLYIVAPEDRLDKVRRELSRPTFQQLELHNRCSFFSSERLIRESSNILRWANDPSAIEKLATHVEDVQDDGVYS